jgi:hypothetical protein
MATAAQARALTARLRRWLWLLPVRIDHPRLWAALLLGVLLRAAVLQGNWWWLREGLTRLVVESVGALGMTVELAGRTAFVTDGAAIAVSVSCTHIEVFALLAPLWWLRQRSAGDNALRLLGLLAALLLAAILRIDFAVLLTALGLPWWLAHDVWLGVWYAVIIAVTLVVGGWMRRDEDGEALTEAAR